MSVKTSLLILSLAAMLPAQTTQQLNVPQRPHRRGAPAQIELGQLDWRLIQPDPDILIGLNMTGLAESDLARTLIAQWTAKLGATEEEQQRILAALGEIPQALISINNKEILAVLNGHVDDFPERSTFGNLQSMRVYADTILLGPPNALKWAMFRLNFDLSPATWLQDAQQLARANDFWISGKPWAFAALGQAVPPNTGVSRFKMGVSLRGQFRMDMFLEMRDPAAAAKMLQGSLKGAPRGMQAGIEGNAVHYALVIDRDTALERFAGFMTDPVGKQFAPLLAAARQMAARQQTPKSAPGKIVIDGLDDGPKEIPAGARRQ